MFALASASLSESSQTFVRQHGKMISPGKTVFVSLEKSQTPPLS